MLFLSVLITFYDSQQGVTSIKEAGILINSEDHNGVALCIASIPHGAQAFCQFFFFPKDSFSHQVSRAIVLSSTVTVSLSWKTGTGSDHT